MPVYEFACAKCGRKIEKIQNYSQSAPDCPGCTRAMVRQLGRFGFRIDGPGAYSKGFSVYK